MNKVTIIEDAVTYIKELQKNVKVLSDQLMEMEASSSMEDTEPPSEDANAAEDIDKPAIQVHDSALHFQNSPDAISIGDIVQ